MKITGFEPVKQTGAAAKPRGASAAGGTSFSSLISLSDTEDASPAAAARPLAAASSLTGLLGIQEVSEEEHKRKKTLQRGRDMVEVLERLRRQLLMGDITPATLDQLAAIINQQKQTVMDPELSALIQDIELRAAVELAKLEMARERAKAASGN